MLNNTLDSKILVIAGTHQREIGFSHPVADLLIKDMGGQLILPDNSMIGDDKATRADVWNLGSLVVAKLYPCGSGEPSKDWFERQSVETLKILADLQDNCSNQKFLPRVAETYGGEHSWSSVHDVLIKNYSPLFFIDLHSFHNNTFGKDGKGLQIDSHSESRYDCLMREALFNAQSKKPDIYGSFQKSFKKLGKIQSEIEARYSKNDLINILTGVDLASKFNFRDIKYQAKAFQQREFDKHYDAGWFFIKQADPEPRGNYYCFEAKHWAKNQQEATAKFITDYLLPEVNYFSVKNSKK